jgi:hypothetical protein
VGDGRWREKEMACDRRKVADDRVSECKGFTLVDLDEGRPSL